MNRLSICARLLLSLQCAVCACALMPQAIAALPGVPADDDHDGINDTLEQKLAERFAPLMYIEADESNYPVNVDWFLARARLQYHEDCTSDVDADVGPNPIGSQLLGPDSSHYWAAGPNCGEDDSGYSHPPHRLLITAAADPDGQFSAGAQTTGYSDQQTFVLTDLADSYKVGSTNPRDWVTYYHAYPTADGGVMIQYWHVFAYNQFGGGFDNHGGDWDASIQVQLDNNLNIEGVWFSRHADDHPGTFFRKADNLVRFFNDTHPVVTIDGGGHAAFRSPEDWATCNCRVGESVTGPIGTVAWTSDTDPFDDPASLRRVEISCNLDNQGQLVCAPTLSSSQGGVIWKTWTDGGVSAYGSLTNPITAPSAHGGLVNLGEYNPCTPTSCYGSQQASTLLAGEFHPLNDQFWLSYEGRWGSIGTINSGPRGPVFQGFQENFVTEIINGFPVTVPTTSTYMAWYNQGANAPATDDGNHPWLVAPSTSATVGSPSYATSSATFVTGGTGITLTASQSSLAAGYGAVTTYYRFYPSGGILSSFAAYSGPFGLRAGIFALADGVYKVEYYSVDGLGNVEPTHTLTLVLDNTAPAVTINQPTATQYPHNATLILDYSASDGTGAGLATVTPKMDGAATLTDGHGLQSGGPAINLLTEMTVGTHTFSVTAADNLSNTRTTSVTFEIIVTADSIKSDVTEFAQAGAIKSSGEANSLLAKLDAAAKARAAGQCNTAASDYRAFINELQGQSGKGVDATAAAIMIADAQYLIAHCP